MNTLQNKKNNYNCTLEDAKSENVKKIRTIAKNAWLEIYPNEKYGITREDITAIDWFNPEEIEKRKKEIKEGNNTHTWVLRDDKANIVGFCKVSKNNNSSDIKIQKEIDGMFIIKEFQGKGLGKKLMQKAIEWLGNDEEIKLEVVSYNTNAINFYKKFGFQETTLPVSKKRTQLPNGKQIPRIVMIRLHQK